MASGTDVLGGPRRPNYEIFSTVGLPDALGREMWEEHNARALIGLGCKTLTHSSLEATEINLALEHLQFAQVTANPHVVERTEQIIDENPADALVLYFTLEGESFFYHREGVRILHPGQALLYDADRPFMRGFTSGLKELALKIPRSVFECFSDGRRIDEPVIFDFSNAGGENSPPTHLARLISTTLRSASAGAAPIAGPEDSSANASNSSGSGATEASALSLVEAMMSGAGTPGRFAHRRAALAFIDRHVREPALSATRIAVGIDISERQLSRVFQSHGTSVARFILEKRLGLARHILTSPRMSNLAIGEIAKDCGFSSQSHFARVFKMRFEMTPLQMRAHATSNPGLSAEQNSPLI